MKRRRDDLPARRLPGFAAGLFGLLLSALSLAACAGDDGSPIPPVPALPPLDAEGHLQRAGARLWYGRIGQGRPVVLLHGGRASRRSWGHQVPVLVAAGYQVVLLDSRGHGASTLGSEPLSYERMADDTLALVDHLQLQRPVIVGWSDGANIALILAMREGARLGGVFAYGASMTRQASRPDAGSDPIVRHVGPMLVRDYAELASDPAGFPAFSQAVSDMQAGQRDYDGDALARIAGVEVAIVAGESDEFIRAEHAPELARHIPGARLHTLAGTGHFAPWLAPEAFNRVLLGFLAGHP